MTQMRFLLIALRITEGSGWHDDIDKHLAGWTSSRDAADVAELLSAAGVPAAVVISARDVVHNPQVRLRHLFEVEHHPVHVERVLRVEGEHYVVYATRERFH